MKGPSSPFLSCSGAAQRGEKRGTAATTSSLSDGSPPSRVRRLIARAMPKSASLGMSTSPTRENRMFDGLMSRCRMPAPWASAVAPAPRSSTASTSMGFMVPRARTYVSRLPPSRNSLIWKGRGAPVRSASPSSERNPKS